MIVLRFVRIEEKELGVGVKVGVKVSSWGMCFINSHSVTPSCRLLS